MKSSAAAKGSASKNWKRLWRRDSRQKEISLTDKLKKEEISLNVSYLALYRYANKFHRILVAAGILASLANGLPMPVMLLIFGRTTDNFVVTEFCDVLDHTNISTICPEDVNPGNINELYPLCNWTGLNVTFPDLTSSIGQRSVEFAIIGAVSWILSWLQTTLLSNAAERIIRNVRYELFRSILYKPVSWFDFHTSGSVSNLLSETTEKFKNGVGDKVGMLAQGLLVTLACAIVSLVSGWKLSLVMLASSPLMIVAVAYLTRVMTRGTGREIKAYSMAGSVAQETFSHIRTVHAFNGTVEMQQRYNHHLDHAYKQALLKGVVVSLTVGAFWLLIFCMYALGFWYGGQLVDGKGTSVGVVLIVFFGIQTAVFTIGGNVPHYSSVTESRSAAYSIYNIIDDATEEYDHDDSSKTIALDEAPDRFIDFENVTFSYPSRREQLALNNVSFRIRKGSTVAFVGESGSGKSTVIQLLLRFYNPDRGVILIDGKRIDKLPLDQLRKMIGLVSQEPVLFSTTIGENIRLGKPEATDEEIRRACQMANALGFIESFPDKFETLVGEGGCQLSGGQKQRISIARALIADPPILLLDEATSALDGESEKIVQEALEVASRGRTTLIVAHRLSTIRNVDVIIGMSDGSVAEVGTHEELMKENGIYRRLVEAQQREEIEEQSEQSKEDSSTPSKAHVKRTATVLSSKSAVSTISGTPEDGVGPGEPPMKDVMLHVLKLNSPELIFIITGTFLVVVWGVLQVVFQIFFARVIVVFSNCDLIERRRIINLQSVRFLAIGIASFIAQSGGICCFTISGERLTRRIRAVLFKVLTRQEIAFFDKKENAVGNICTMLSTEASAVQGATGIRIGTTLSGMSILILGLVISMVYGWQLALVILAFVPVLIGAGIISMQVMAGFSAKDKKHLERAGKIVIESTLNIRTVKQLLGEEYFLRTYMQEIDQICSRNLKKTIITGALFGFSQGVVFFAIAGCYYAGADFVERGFFTIEKMMTVFGCLLFGAMSVGQSQAMAPDFGKSVTAAKRIYVAVNRVPEIDAESKEGEKPSDYRGKYEFNRVHFTYPERKGVKVLRGVTLKMDSDKKTALVGFSGSGKSTIMQMLERFYDPDSGTIYLDGRDIRTLNLAWYRQQMGMVSQEPVLFNWSIKENIAFGDNTRSLTMQEIRSAAKAANIDDFIIKLPEGYDTVVGSKGSLLSGGQKQRVCIARAIIRNPKVLLLDEATSALDNESEKVVQEAIEIVQKDRGSVTVAHRLATIEKSDNIYLMDNGRLIEEGTHAQLLKQKGQYYELYKHSQR